MRSRFLLLTLFLSALLLPLLAACGVPQDEHNAVKAERDTALAAGVRIEQERQDLATQVAELEDERDEANETIAGLEVDAGLAVARIATIEAEWDAALGRVAELEETGEELSASLAELRDSHEELLASVGGLEGLESQKASLESTVADLLDEIDSLREQRLPLVPDASQGEFLCTGSMNPVITCMDQAVWLENFDPADIIVGAVISFDASALDCRVSSERVAHRVIDIRVESGTHKFLTRGDNNRGDDGCWIPESYVHSYMTELIEQDYPEMQALLDQVWPLEAQEDALLDELDELEEDYQSASNGYDDMLDAFCSWDGSEWTCPSQHYSTVLNAYDLVNSLVTGINSRLSQYFAVCEQIRSLRVQLQALRDVHYGPTTYEFPSCT